MNLKSPLKTKTVPWRIDMYTRNLPEIEKERSGMTALLHPKAQAKMSIVYISMERGSIAKAIFR